MATKTKAATVTHPKAPEEEPIGRLINLTAKAMRGDRERSLAAGANEHVAKPVEVDVLLTMIGSMISG